MMRCALAVGAALALITFDARADDPPPIKLTLTPAKPPTPALRYQLLPDARITIAGDAAPLYRQVIELLDKKDFKQNWSRLFDWAELPPDKLRIAEVRKVLAEYDDAFPLLDKAARCDRCDWGVLERL